MKFSLALLFVSSVALADPVDFDGRWYAHPSQTQYTDQRGGSQACASGVDIRVEQDVEKFNFVSFNYDCGPAPGGDRARPYFMLDWKSARIDGDRLLRNGQVIGKFQNDDVVFEMDQQLNGATIHHRVTLRRESQNRVILEHVTSTFGVDVRLVRAYLDRL